MAKELSIYISPEEFNMYPDGVQLKAILNDDGVLVVQAYRVCACYRERALCEEAWTTIDKRERGELVNIYETNCNSELMIHRREVADQG